MPYTYKNISNQELVIPQVGSVKPNETIPSDHKLINKNLEIVNNQPVPPVSPQSQQPVQPATTQPTQAKVPQEGESK